MNATVIDIKASKSGKSDVICIQVTTTKETPFGTSTTHKFFNHAVASGSSKLAIDQEFELDLNQFEVRKSMLTYSDGSEHECLWLDVR